MSVTGLGRIAMADRMSVDQLKEALQNKTLPAYIAIPLIEEKMDMQQRMAQSQAMQQQQQLPIADQILARSEPGIEQLPTGLPMAEMAGGGIVAFADGGVSDDDDEEDDDSFDEAVDKENAELLRKLMAVRGMGAGQGITGLPVPSGAMGIDSLGSGLRMDSAVGETPATPRTSLSESKVDSGMGLKAPKGHKYAEQITAKAEQMGLDPQFALYIAGKETGGLRNPETAKSSAGALGIMQLMPGTAKDMGVKDPLDPEQNITGGLRYAKLMLDKYGDPKLAAIAYNWGPGNTDKWLKAGADPMKLPKETRNYVASLKEGGEVKRMQVGGLGGVPVYEDIEGGPTGVMQRDELVKELTLSELQEYNRSGMIPPRLRSKVGGRDIGKVPLFGTTTDRAERPVFGSAKPTAAQKAEEDKYRGQYEAQDLQEGPIGRLEAPASAAQAAAAVGEEKPAGMNLQDRLEALLSKRESGLAAQREQDKYMAILAAGLGMMGGTSRNALENIGKGALQGVAAKQASDKARAAEENAILSGRLGQYKVGQTEALRKQLSEESQQNRLTQQLSAARQNMLRNVIAAKKLDINALDQSQLSRLEAEADAMLARDPAYQAMYKKLYGNQFTATAPAAAPVDYTKKYGTTPKS